MPSMYEQMNADDGDTGPDSEPPGAPDDKGGEELDPEFEMHAKGAGLSAEQAGHLKMAIERCVDLREQNGYSGGHDDQAEEGDEET